MQISKLYHEIEKMMNSLKLKDLLTYGILALGLWLPTICAFHLTHSVTSKGFRVGQDADKTTTTALYSVVDTQTSSPPTITIALTREKGNNEKLKKELNRILNLNDCPPDSPRIQLIEIPCIAHADGEDLPKLRETLQTGCFDYVAVTSPEAARVLATAWDSLQEETTTLPLVAAVGAATQQTLERHGIPVHFCPSKATAETLVAELPPRNVDAPNKIPSLLYPASARAASTLAEGFQARGFQVTRLNTYDTTTAQWTDEERQWAKQTNIVCFGSPSAVEAWRLNTQWTPALPNGDEVQDSPALFAACIGETSAQACRKFQFPESCILYPEKPGIPGWAQAAQQAVQQQQQQRMLMSLDTTTAASEVGSP
jgi:uroporphyrinogen-III synthase